MNQEIKYCPYCGKLDPTLVMYKGKNGNSDRYCVVCSFVDGGCGAQSGWSDNEEGAITRWNNRANDWVKAADFPPPENVRIMAYLKDGQIKELRVRKNSCYDEEDWFCYKSFITCWMPTLFDPGEVIW